MTFIKEYADRHPSAEMKSVLSATAIAMRHRETTQCGASYDKSKMNRAIAKGVWFAEQIAEQSNAQQARSAHCSSA